MVSDLPSLGSASGSAPFSAASGCLAAESSTAGQRDAAAGCSAFWMVLRIICSGRCGNQV